LNRKQKEETIQQLATVLSDSQAVFLTDFKGLNVEEMRDLRRKIRDAGGRYLVIKNTLGRLAAQGLDAEKLTGLMMGNNAVGLAREEPVAVAKALVDYAKGHEKMVIKGGVLSGQLLNVDQIKAMASLPPREVLLAQLLGGMNAVPTGLVRVMAAVIQNFVYALAAIHEQKEQQEA